MSELREVAASVKIQLPVERAWRVLSDLSVPHHYVPGLVRTEITTSQKTGVGAARRVWRSNGQWLDETLVEWEEGRGFLIRLHREEQPMMPALFSEAFFRYRIAEHEDGSGMTLASTSLIFRLKAGGLAGRLLSLLLSFAMRRQTAAVARGMKRYYEEAG